MHECNKKKPSRTNRPHILVLKVWSDMIHLLKVKALYAKFCK